MRWLYSSPASGIPTSAKHETDIGATQFGSATVLREVDLGDHPLLLCHDMARESDLMSSTD